MSRTGRIGKRVAVGVCGPVALTAISGAITPASAATQGGNNHCTPSAFGYVQANEASRTGNNIYGSAYADCLTVNSSTPIAITVTVQKNLNGWTNAASTSLTGSNGYATASTLVVNGCQGSTQPTQWRTSVIVTTSGGTYGISSTGTTINC